MPGPPSSRFRLLGRKDRDDKEVQRDAVLGVLNWREGHGAGGQRKLNVKEVKMYKGSEPLGKGKKFPVVLEAQATRLPCELPHRTTEAPSSSLLISFEVQSRWWSSLVPPLKTGYLSRCPAMSPRSVTYCDLGQVLKSAVSSLPLCGKCCVELT